MLLLRILLRFAITAKWSAANSGHGQNNPSVGALSRFEVPLVGVIESSKNKNEIVEAAVVIMSRHENRKTDPPG